MNLSEETLHFIREHRNEDVRALALLAHRYPMVDMPNALTQITGWKVSRDKIPTWATHEMLLYPPHLSMEQCSSEATARYKTEVIRTFSQKEDVSPWDSLTDLTGGFGIDCAFLSSCFKKVTYVEQQEILCEIASHNFPLLGLNHITVSHEDGIRHLQQMAPVDWIFIDPARRNSHGGKTVAISDCEPNIAALEKLLLEKARHVLVKLSPMLDLTLALHDLKHVQQVHVVSLNNECKELLLVLGHVEKVGISPSKEAEAEVPIENIPIHCINLNYQQGVQSLIFNRREEKELPARYTSTLKTYLYEPNVSILKAGAYRSISSIYKVEKLHPNSHLYTSDNYIPDFPGRKFRIIKSGSLNKKEVKELLGTEKKSNLTVRNFPASVAELRKRLKLAEGGELYLFATTLADERKLLISCKQIH
mgnify:FL=1